MTHPADHRAMSDTVTVTHPEHGSIEVTERRARLLAHQGWVRADAPPPPSTPDPTTVLVDDPDGLEA